MTLLQIGVCFCIIQSLTYAEDQKWVWKDNGRSSRGSDRASPRYEIYEKDEIDYPGGGGTVGGFGGTAGLGGFGGTAGLGGLGGGGPGFDFNRPGRPGQRPYPRPTPPGPIGGGGFVDGPYRPGFEGGYPEDGYPGRPGFPGRPDLDRPGLGGAGLGGPGFDGRPPFKKFDTCTCSARFNCQSPGISYGHCDAGKSYCCFNKHGQIDIEPAPSRPIHSPENGILVGPGHGSGGYGKPGYAGRPGLGRPGFGGGGLGSIRPGDEGILVGPGGPTGIVGRPGGYGRPENGVLVGPGGPFDRPYGRPYGRSAGDVKKE